MDHFILVLASSSPNRKALLERLHLPFLTRAPDIDESPLDDELPVATAKRLAHLKGLKVIETLMADDAFCTEHESKTAIVIASDQVAFQHLAGQKPIIYDKPHTRERAVQQLLHMQGGRIGFMTALEVTSVNISPQRQFVEKTLAGGVMTYASFRPLNAMQIERYVTLDEPLQCAGAAKCESLGIALLSQVSSSDPTALIGLPLILLTDFLESFGVSVL